MLKIAGYPDRYSVAPGESIRFMVSLEEGDAFDARLVRVIHGDCNPAGPGLKFAAIDHPANGRFAGRRQPIDAGSYMIAASVPALAGGAFTFTAYLWPTLPKRPMQVVAAQWNARTQAGFKLAVDEGALTLVTGDGQGRIAHRALSCRMLNRAWYAIRVRVDGKAHRFELEQRPLTMQAMTDEAGKMSGSLEVVPGKAKGLHIAGCPQTDGTVGEHFDGKIDSPMLVGQGRKRIARWDFSRDMPSTRVLDIGPHKRHGKVVNLPARAMKGWNWTGEEHRWTLKPEHYGAIHFHHDDLYDAGWETSVEMAIPAGFRSGAYALHIRSGPSDETATREDYLPFFVRPPRTPGRRRNAPKVAFLAPTCAYMAYANHAEHITAREAERTMGRLLQFGHADLYMYAHPELAGSLYDSHLDGSGVCMSSRLRPVLNFSPHYHSWVGGHGSGLWQYNADTHLLDWLEHRGVDYDVITDEDLHYDGYKLLKDYRVILTGTHPEYHSTPMWDGMKKWLDGGGRLMYLGANGWYWRIAFHRELPGVIEVRRAEDGIRTWAAEPGEYHHAFTGELGGLWRRIGRPPNVMCGVGFIAQGFDVCSYFRRAPDADNPRAAFIFEGVPDETIGDFGLIGGGAAGLELDCISTRLGSPPNTLRLASSENHSALVLLVNEEFGVVPVNLGGDQNDRVRADLAFAELPAGGALFSVSSIAWCGSLSHNGYDNNVSRITGNVLQRFLDEAPFS
ncbi:MAG: N,N-dimethylformamidase large subunit [Pseudomonadota bacterium]|nr:N,N-dimethylformamidase large subunit [Pseudomonadota bacterium]